MVRPGSALVAALLVAGCSGGDGGGGNDGGDPPVADAGFDGEGRLHQTYMLDGTGSADPEGKDLTYDWLVLSAPDGSAVTVSNGGFGTASFVPDVPGSYLFGLLVSDGKNTSGLDTVEVEARIQAAVFGVPTAVERISESLRSFDDVDVAPWTSVPDSLVAGASGPYVLYTDRRSGTLALIAHDTGSSIGPITIAAGEIESPFIDGNRVVWMEKRDGQWDLFANDLETSLETRLTDTLQQEFLSSVAGGIAVWQEERVALRGLDVYAYDLEVGVEIAVAETAVDEFFAATDGESIAFTADDDVLRYEIAGMTTATVSTSGSAFVFGNTGDYVVFGGFGEIHVREVTTGSAFVLTASGGDVRDVDGDYVLYEDATDLRVWQLSTRTSTALAPATDASAAVLAGGAAGWVAADDVWHKVLPAGASTQVTDTASVEREVVLAATGIAWDVETVRGRDVVFTDDGGASANVLSTGKAYLDDALEAYDLVVFARGNVEYTGIVAAAVDAAGLPMLGVDSQSGLSERLQADGQYGLEMTYGASCGPLRVGVTLHPVFEGWPAGTILQLDNDDLDDVVTFAKGFDASGTGTVPGDFEAITFFDDLACGVPSGDSALVTFSTSAGTRVLLDGAISQTTTLSETRQRLLYNEVRWLATRP